MLEKILIVDDDFDALKLGVSLLRPAMPNAEFLTADSPSQADQILTQQTPAVMVLDLCLSPLQGVSSGFELLTRALQADPSLRIIVLTGYDDQEVGIKALQMGAANFLSKPVSYQHLAALIIDGIKQSQLKRCYQATVNANTTELAQKIFGGSKFNQELITALAFASGNQQPILITGETGTGKGYCAELIHQYSDRRAKQFVRLQPFFSSADLVASELFGHQKGSFTGANWARPGLLQQANGGSLFLDEIDAFPREVQISLLGVLQDKKYRPIGSDTELESDFRLIAASNQPMDSLLEQGKFRPDLYYRLSGFRIHLLPLRERKEDLPDLAQSLLSPGFVLSAPAIQQILDYSWPGNIRELQSVLKNAEARLASTAVRVISSIDLNYTSRTSRSVTQTFQEKVEAYKTQLVQEALSQANNSQVKAARFLGIDRTTLRRILCK